MTGSPVVIDASITLSLVLQHPLRQAARSVTNTLKHRGFHFSAPTLWAYETTSGISKAVHFKMISEADAWQVLALIAAMDVKLISPDETQSQRALTWTLRMNRIAANESYYLALAETLGCDLWTADRRLYSVVDLPWVRWVEDQPDNRDRVYHESRPQS